MVTILTLTEAYSIKVKTICERNFAKHKATAVYFPGFVQCDHRGKCWKIILFAVACVRYAFPFVFEAKEEEGRAGSGTSGFGCAKSGTRATHPRTFTFAIFTRFLTLVPRSLLRDRTKTFARQAYAGYVCFT